MLGFLNIQYENDSVFVFIDNFLNITHFIPYKKINDANKIIEILFREIVCLHKLPKSIAFDHDSKILSNFWKMIWRKLDTKL